MWAAARRPTSELVFILNKPEPPGAQRRGVARLVIGKEVVVRKTFENAQRRRRHSDLRREWKTSKNIEKRRKTLKNVKKRVWKNEHVQKHVKRRKTSKSVKKRNSEKRRKTSKNVEERRKTSKTENKSPGFSLECDRIQDWTQHCCSRSQTCARWQWYPGGGGQDCTRSQICAHPHSQNTKVRGLVLNAIAFKTKPRTFVLYHAKYIQFFYNF